jgi:SAM-dependent methyltransferase
MGPAPLDVAEGNRDMLTAWDGDEGTHWTEQAERFERAAAPYRRRLLSAAALAPGLRVLDVGCGAGRTTREAAAMVAPDGHVLGLDLSSQMLARAAEQARSEGRDNARFVQADAQVYPFELASFDLAISQFGVMFFADPAVAFTNVSRALAPDARLAFMVWQSLAHNDWARSLRTALSAGRVLPDPPPGAPGPFSLSDPDRLRALLEGAGLERIDVEPVAGDFLVGTDTADALDFVRGMGITRTLLADLDDAATAAAMDDLRATLAAHETADGVLFASAAWLATAHKPRPR